MEESLASSGSAHFAAVAAFHRQNRVGPSFARLSPMPKLRSVAVPFAFAFALTTVIEPTASAKGPYVVLRDDGSLNGTITKGPGEILGSIMTQYDQTGLARPDIVSVWTNFSMNGNDVNTFFLPGGIDIKGINVKKSVTKFPPVKAVLLHNNVLSVKAGAELVGAPEAGYAEYLFLLELSHVWGPNVLLPAVDGGVAEDALWGYPYHWSYWFDPGGGSPAGGNVWKDNKDGTFTAASQLAGDVTYSMLDLYLMGLAEPSEVTPATLLTNAVPPNDVVDPFNGKKLSNVSFPNFTGKPVTVTAKGVPVTVDDVIAANGVRLPAAKDAQKSFTLGIVLLVAANASDDDVAKAEAALDPIAVKLAPAFERATRKRATMTVVTQAPADVDAGADASVIVPPNESSGGCSTSGDEGPSPLGGLGILAGVAAFVAAARRRR